VQLASVASQVGITCSPIAAAVASFVIISNANGFEVNNLQVIAITIPACLCGLMAAALVSYRRGLDLDKDPAFQARLKDPQMKEYMYGSSASVLDKEVPKEAKRAVYIFLAAIAVIVLFSVFQIIGHDIRPKFPTGKVIDGVAQVKPLAMNIIIQIVMIRLPRS
jgi:Anaerobic C4-dicarboxylate transporter